MVASWNARPHSGTLERKGARSRLASWKRDTEACSSLCASARRRVARARSPLAGLLPLPRLSKLLRAADLGLTRLQMSTVLGAADAYTEPGEGGARVHGRRRTAARKHTTAHDSTPQHTTHNHS
eukprot:6894988-Prymnesium_polylepis.1